MSQLPSWRSWPLAVAAAIVGAALPAPTASAQPTLAQVSSHAPPAAGEIVLRGTVYDSLAGAPLQDATVQAVRSDDPRVVRTARTDSLGRFAFEGLAATRHVLGFLHPALEPLQARGVEVRSVLVDLSAGASGEVALAVPGAATVRAALCPPPVAGTDADAPADAGTLGGVVRDAHTDAPLPGAALTITWRELNVSRAGVRPETPQIPVAIQADGGFLVCGLPVNTPLTLRLQAPGRALDSLELLVPPEGVVFQDVALVPSLLAPAGAASVDVVAAPGAATRTDSVAIRRDALPAAAAPGPVAVATGAGRLNGVVVDSAGRPVVGALVQVAGTPAATRTDSAGRFALGGLPVGTRTLEARAIGLAALRRPVTLAPDRPATLRLTMARASAALDPVVVRAARTEADLLAAGFASRRATGIGRFLGPDDIARERHLFVTPMDLVRRMSGGLTLRPNGLRGWMIRGPNRGGPECIPAAWIDGAAVFPDAIDELVLVDQIAAVEVYPPRSVIPAHAAKDGRGRVVAGWAPCGAVVIWTKR